MSSLESDYERTSDSRSPYKTLSSLIAFTLTVLVICFMAFTIVFVFKYYFVSVIRTWAFLRTASSSLIHLSPNRSHPPTCLDPSLLQIFPTFLYINVKELRKEKYSLECAICLIEFEDDNMHHLLSVCCHVFHQECINLWLHSHKTCPICRRDLDSPTTNKEGQEKSTENQEIGECSTSDDVHIDIREGEGDGDVGGGEIARDQRHENKCHGDYPVSVSMSRQQHEEEQMFARSHSTGHSIVLIRGGDEKDNDKYTLRLPSML